MKKHIILLGDMVHMASLRIGAGAYISVMDAVILGQATQSECYKAKKASACLEQRRYVHFSPFMVSTDGLLGKEARVLLTKLSTGSPRSDGRNRTPKFSDMSMLVL